MDYDVEKMLNKMAAELRDKTRVEIFVMDVTDADACVDLFKKADFEFGRVDILVNNAGYHARGRVRDVSAGDLGRIIDVNLKAPIILTRLALPYLEEAGGGVIINVASLHGRLASPGAAAYSSSKFGLRIFTFALRQELEGSGVKAAVVFSAGFAEIGEEGVAWQRRLGEIAAETGIRLVGRVPALQKRLARQLLDV